MLDQLLIRHCSPTLAGLKTAGLFNYKYSSSEELDYVLTCWNQELNPKGVSLHPLCQRSESALIYVCRNSMLIEDWEREGIPEFLETCGYACLNPEACINQLREKLHNNHCFPHEIGVFLGYPLDDVKAFITNKGKGCKLIGQWKVYHNEREALKLFTKYNRCKEAYTQLFENHFQSVSQLTVSTV